MKYHKLADCFLFGQRHATRAAETAFPSSWFAHQAAGHKAAIVESGCRTCRLSIGAATHPDALLIMELSHLVFHHPRGLLSLFLRS
jgi:hypothetical protein